MVTVDQPSNVNDHSRPTQRSQSASKPASYPVSQFAQSSKQSNLWNSHTAHPFTKLTINQPTNSSAGVTWKRGRRSWVRPVCLGLNTGKIFLTAVSRIPLPCLKHKVHHRTCHLNSARLSVQFTAHTRLYNMGHAWFSIFLTLRVMVIMQMFDDVNYLPMAN